MVLEETMASKVCPVCKTFTSSNTTLNAHIDQCLSGESTIKRTKNWTETWTVKKKRVTYKLRKTRSMLDICKTAPSCTLEELERRNNDTNWATDLSVRTQHIEIHGEEQENEQGRLDDNVMEPDQDEGAVNINSGGMENQILSVPRIGAEVDHGSRKHLRLTHHSSSPKPLRDFEMESDHEEIFSVDEDYQKDDAPEQSFESEEGSELDDAEGILEPWECTRNLPVERPVESDETSLENRSFSTTLSSSDTPISSDEPENDEYFDHLPLIKRVARRFRSSASKKGVELRGKSSRKKVMCVSRKSVPELRSGLKRKFSALKETLENVGPSQADHLQDSSAHVSQMIKEITETGTGIETSEDSEEQALSVLPSNTIMDSLADEEESSKKETEVHEEGPTIKPNSLNSDTHSQNSIVVYQGPCSEPILLTLSSQPVVDDGEMIVGEDVHETMNGQTNCEIELEDSEMGNGVGFLEVEPIHIPSPPGSFLPSPGADMGSEDVQGNSSLTDSRVQASEERHDLILEDVQWNSSLTNGRVQSSEEPLDLVSEDVQGKSSLTNNGVSEKRLDLVSEHVWGNSSLTNNRVLSSEDPLDLVSKDVQGNSSLTNCRVEASKERHDLVSEHLQENLSLANSKVRSPQDPLDLVSEDVQGKPSLTNSRGQSPEDPLDLISKYVQGNPSLTNSRGQTPDGRLVFVSEDVQGNTSLTNNRVQSSEDSLDLVSEDVQGNPSLANSRGQSSEGRLVLVSEDVQGNTSLTNNMVQSSELRLDLADQDSILESLISTTPTNPTLTVRSVVAVEENPVQQEANMVEETTEATLPENSVAPSLTNDHQPFMEGMAQSFTSLYQVSALLKIRRSIWNNHPVNFYFDLENNSSTTGHVPTTAATDKTAAASPSFSNHVLRLMGKDLMVANKDQVGNNASFPVVPVSREMMIDASTPAMRNGNVPEGSSLVGAVSREMMYTSSGMCNRVPENSVVGVCSAPVPAHQRSTTT